MKKKPTEKLAKTINLFEKIGIDIDEDQVQVFLTNFELLKNEAITEAVKPLQEKIDTYQKRNFELAAALEEAKQTRKDGDKLLEGLSQKINNFKIPDIPNIEKTINSLLSEKLNLMEKKIVKMDEILNKMNEKILPLNVTEDAKKITDIGNLFNNYKAEFAKHLVELESTELKKIREQLLIAERKLTEFEKKSVRLEEQIIRERTNTEITILLENSPLDRQEKEHLYKYYEKLGYEEGKSEIQKFITMKENKEREKPAPRSYVRESIGGVKPINETGVLRKSSRLGESTSFSREMDEWATAAGVDESETV